MSEAVCVGRTDKGITVAVTSDDTVLSAEIDAAQAKLLVKLLLLALDDLENLE